MSDKFARLEEARRAREAKAPSFDAGPAPWIKLLPPRRGELTMDEWRAKYGRPLPRVAVQRIAREVTQDERERWSFRSSDDPEPRVTHDSGWYCPIPGRPLPPIEWFEVSGE